VAVNVRALQQREPNNPALRKYGEVAATLAQDSEADSEHSAKVISGFSEQFSIPSLRALGLASQDIPKLVEQVARASSTKANPIALTAKELTELAERAW
jgi:alcohol dehydrogenase